MERGATVRGRISIYGLGNEAPDPYSIGSRVFSAGFLPCSFKRTRKVTLQPLLPSSGVGVGIKPVEYLMKRIFVCSISVFSVVCAGSAVAGSNNNIRGSYAFTG